MTVHERLRAAVEVPTEAALWGQAFTVTPRVVRRRFGNGQQLLRIAPIETRPMYYVVRISSAWHIDCGGVSASVCKASNCLREHLDEIYEAMEDEIDALTVWEDDDGREIDHDEADVLGIYDPHCVLEMGTVWGEMEWPALDGRVRR